MRARALLLAAAVSSGAGCELATHAFDYRVGPPATATSLPALCAACPGGASAGLALPPCPSPAAAPSSAAGTLVYAARRSRLGHAADLASSSFDLGFDLDCSARPGGVPVRCAPRTAAGWVPLPRGIDDALLAQALAPVYEQSQQASFLDLDEIVSQGLEQGRYGVVIEVEGWNGLPDDESVAVSVHTSPGLAGRATPEWNGGDAWLVYPDVEPDGVRRFAVDHAPGYVAGGVLVADARAAGTSLFRFGPGAARFDLLVSGLFFTATITPTSLQRLTLSGTLEPSIAQTATLSLAARVAACGAGSMVPFLSDLAPRIALAPDMPSDPAATPTDPCDAISFGWSLDAEPAQLAEGGGAVGEGDPGCP